MKQTPAIKLVAHFRMHPPRGVTLDLEPDLYLRRGKQTECQRRVALVHIKRESSEPGTGAIAMRELCARADELRVEIVLSVPPKALGLLAYFRSFDFEWVPSRGEYHAMRRRPQAMDGRVDNPTVAILSALRTAARIHDAGMIDPDYSPQERIYAERRAKEVRTLLMMFESGQAEVILRSGV